MHKWILYTTMAVSTMWSVCFVFITIFQCRPPSYYWNRNQSGRCLSPNFIINASIAYGVISMATDFTIGTLPIFIVWRLQMNRRSKFAVAGVLAMAAVFVLSAFIQRLISETDLRIVLVLLPLFDSLIFRVTGILRISFVSHVTLVRIFQN